MLLAFLLLALAQLALGADITQYKFSVNLENGVKDSFTIEVHDEWAPLGAARFHELVAADFFPGVRFFRTIKGFMSQFGISGKPEVSKVWRDKKIADDKRIESNKRGYLSFATSGKDSRTTQIFVNL
jgi:peptidyl-prolyl cis-trans isomerase A (cyclophilin A)